jgi:hypothetical protein
VVAGLGDFPFEEETLALLQVGLPYMTQRACSDDAILAGQRAARLGYLSRSAEFAKFDAAREADGDLLDAFDREAEDGAGRRLHRRRRGRIRGGYGRE